MTGGRHVADGLHPAQVVGHRSPRDDRRVLRTGRRTPAAGPRAGSARRRSPGTRASGGTAWCAARSPGRSRARRGRDRAACSRTGSAGRCDEFRPRNSPSVASNCHARSVRKHSSAPAKSGLASSTNAPWVSQVAAADRTDSATSSSTPTRAAQVCRESDPQAGERTFADIGEGPARLLQRDRRPTVGSGHHRQQQGQVIDRPGHRTLHRQTRVPVGGRIHRYPAGGRPEPDDVAVPGGQPQRSAHVVAVGQRVHAGGQRGRGAAGRPARRHGQVVGVAGDAEDLVERVPAGGELRDVGLADGDDAGGFIRSITRSSSSGTKSALRRRPEGRSDPRRQVIVLVRHR